MEGGGSTDTFFVREDSEVGEEVGRVRLNGEAGWCVQSWKAWVFLFIIGIGFQSQKANTRC